ncbi:MAG: OmpA family protein [Desulfarculales bacterium]|jgi:chemotaxis protein MotB|nr:OmpA family protein [Desulfarculales bacterium]
MSGYNVQLNPLALDTLPIAPVVDLRPSLAGAGPSPAQAGGRPNSAREAEARDKFAGQSRLEIPASALPGQNDYHKNSSRPLARLRSAESSPSFYMSLSDLMCLLLVFFVLIFSLTEKGGSRVIPPQASQALAGVIKAKPAAADPFPQPTLLSQSLRKGLMGLTALGQPDPGLAAEKADPPVPGNARFSPGEQAHHRLLSQVRAEISHISGLEVAVKGESVILRMPEVMLFNPGKAELNSSLQPALRRVGQVLGNFPQARLKITGHTDDRPIRTTQYASNWELSGARAAAVARSLVQGGYNAERITIQGMADHSPLLPNINDYNRARNRRVEVEIELSQTGKAAS